MVSYWAIASALPAFGAVRGPTAGQLLGVASATMSGQPKTRQKVQAESSNHASPNPRATASTTPPGKPNEQPHWRGRRRRERISSEFAATGKLLVDRRLHKMPEILGSTVGQDTTKMVDRPASLSIATGIPDRVVHSVQTTTTTAQRMTAKPGSATTE